METSPEKRGLRAGVTVGRVVNVVIALIFFVLFMLALVVVGTLSVLHGKASCPHTQCKGRYAMWSWFFSSSAVG